jgi:hypothetical protein
MRIVCTDNGHALAPISGDAWQIVQDSRPLTNPAVSKEGTKRCRQVASSNLAGVPDFWRMNPASA